MSHDSPFHSTRGCVLYLLERIFFEKLRLWANFFLTGGVIAVCYSRFFINGRSARG